MRHRIQQHVLSVAMACAVLWTANAGAASAAATATNDVAWDAVGRSAGTEWQELDTRTRQAATHDMAAARAAAQAAERLGARLDSVGDRLDGLARDDAALLVPGVARRIYVRANALVGAGDHARALKLFSALAASSNADGFVVGNSHYWRGVLLHEVYGQPDAALPCFLEVHRHAACLVFTDDAYIRAARMYAWRGHYDTALALYAIRIPSIDYYDNEWRKALASTDLARRFGDVTNQVRQALRVRDAAAHAPRFAPAAAQLWQDIDAGLAPSGRLAIAEYLAGAESFDLYAMQAIQRALTGPDAATNDARLTDMLLHAWPSFDWVEQMHPVIVTNRELSNNIFEQKRHTELLPSNP